MAAAQVRLGFFKLNVPEMAPALAFWAEAFGFTVTTSFDEPEFLEHILALPGQETGPNLLLVAYKDGRDVGVGPGHGPVGLICDDIETAHGRALACGASQLTGVFETAGVKVAMLRSPQGHEIELIQLPAS
ncbi:VOC family protein [Croceibacterium sp. LX-88]|uniref:VOC family protein n=1 Tax=Croceibacterium selenioxidans TaxID=2838833 RepID=A0ABS5W0H5_9SPHN|nr:VOC family protein [Croceibacterium selenioxidans]MBT2133280.1 VOC family protein [Croceibacterium selenioxidans]